MTARLGVLATIKHIVAIWLMVKALQLIARKFRTRLAEMRAKLARLEGADTALA